MKKYCMSCGSPTEYNLKIPNFCSNCGKSFSTLKDQEVVKKQNPTINIQKDFDDDYEDEARDHDVLRVPNISKLDIEEDLAEVKDKGIKLGSLVGTSNSKREKGKKLKKNISRKKILEEFANEAGSIRKKTK